MDSICKVGDCIFKKSVNESSTVNESSYRIVYLVIAIKEIHDGNWHDGYTMSYIATIRPSNQNEEYSDEEYLVAYWVMGMVEPILNFEPVSMAPLFK